MRFLIAFLCCYAIQFQYTYAEELPIPVAKKIQVKTVQTLLTFKGVSPLKSSNSFSKDFMDQHCASQQQNHIRISLNGEFPAKLNIPSFQAIYLHFGKFKLLQKLNYQFIFNFLYPKHAFW